MLSAVMHLIQFLIITALSISVMHLIQFLQPSNQDPTLQIAASPKPLKQSVLELCQRRKIQSLIYNYKLFLLVTPEIILCLNSVQCAVCSVQELTNTEPSVLQFGTIFEGSPNYQKQRTHITHVFELLRTCQR